MKRMLFNATQAEELRVAIVDGQKLIDLDIESAGKEQRKSNIYKGVITRIEPSLEAAFVNYGAERHGFLPFKEIARANFAEGVEGRSRIQDALREGQEIIVQVEKDERGNKGAALTTYISLAGRYLVLMPNNPRGGGVSRRIEGEDRNELREVMAQLEVPHGMSIIARTAGIGRTQEELQWDLNYLLHLWNAIESAAKSQSGAFLIYQEGSLVIRAIRDYFQPDIGEILIDTPEIYDQASQFMGHVMPQNVGKVKLYTDDIPLFSRFQIEHQIETAFSREVPLPSGGAIIIDHTEALVSIDVNSARATKGSDIEQTAFNTNLEAADEAARQLRLRDLGGLIVIDFIDMESQRNQREVEKRLSEALHYDRARVQMGKISRFGLMELSRQRLQPSLGETSHIACPRCQGTGHIRGIESSALHILRLIQEEAMKDNTHAIHAQVPVDVATFLLNEKRADIHSIEARLRVSVVLIPNIHMETPAFTLTRLRRDEADKEEILPSYKMVETPSGEEEPAEAKTPRQQAAVQGITPEQPAPIVTPAAPESTGWLGKFKKWFHSLGAKEEEKPPVKKRPSTSRQEPRRRSGEGRRQERGESRGETRGENRPARPARQERSERPERPARQERPARAEVEAKEIRSAQPAAKPESAAADAGSEGTRSRGRNRRGRGRGERREETGAPAVTETVHEERAPAADTPPRPVEAASQEESPVTAKPIPAPAPEAEESPAAPAPAETRMETPAVKREDPSVAAQAAGLEVIETKAEFRAMDATPSVEPESKPRAPRQRRAAARSETTEAPVALTLVETKPEAAVSMPETTTAETMRKPRAPRPWEPAQAEVPNEPLVLVETKKEQ